jgi:hypothetical protein
VSRRRTEFIKLDAMVSGHAGNRAPSPLRRVRRGDLAIQHRADLPAQLVVEAIARHREHDALGRQACEKWGPGSSVSRVELGSGAQRRELAVKLHRWRGVRGALSDWWRASRAARARAGRARLTSCGVDSPDLLAIVERRRAGVVLESWELSEFRAGWQPLPVALAERAAMRGSRRALLAALGDLVGGLHAAGVDHPDLKPSNLLVGTDGRIALLDLDALIPPRRLGWRRRVRALGQLEAYARDLAPWLSRADRLRVLRAYLARDPAPRDEGGRLAREASAWAARRVAAWSRRDRGVQRHFPLGPRAGGEPGAAPSPRV